VNQKKLDEKTPQGGGPRWSGVKLYHRGRKILTTARGGGQNRPTENWKKRRVQPTKQKQTSLKKEAVYGKGGGGGKYKGEDDRHAGRDQASFRRGKQGES